jgi:uncharacterized membrane protein YkvA (DUF1232 family)
MSAGNEFDKQEFFALFMNEDVPFSYKFFLVAVVGLYTISPIDFLPEGLLGVFGFADDLGIIWGAAQVFTYFANKHLEAEHEQKQELQAQQQVIGAQATTTPNTQQQTDAPRVIRNRERLAPPPQSPNQGETNVDYLSDEWHERYLQDKTQQSTNDFDKLVQERDQRPKDWDYSRNNPFEKRHRDGGSGSQ